MNTITKQGIDVLVGCWSGTSTGASFERVPTSTYVDTDDNSIVWLFSDGVKRAERPRPDANRGEQLLNDGKNTIAYLGGQKVAKKANLNPDGSVAVVYSDGSYGNWPPPVDEANESISFSESKKKWVLVPKMGVSPAEVPAEPVSPSGDLGQGGPFIGPPASLANVKGDPTGVKWFQYSLNRVMNPVPPLKLDGKIGDKTRAVARAYQAKKGLPDTGPKGNPNTPATIRALEEDLVALGAKGQGFSTQDLPAVPPPSPKPSPKPSPMPMPPPAPPEPSSPPLMLGMSPWMIVGGALAAILGVGFITQSLTKPKSSRQLTSGS